MEAGRAGAWAGEERQAGMARQTQHQNQKRRKKRKRSKTKKRKDKKNKRGAAARLSKDGKESEMRGKRGRSVAAQSDPHGSHTPRGGRAMQSAQPKRAARLRRPSLRSVAKPSAGSRVTGYVRALPRSVLPPSRPPTAPSCTPSSLALPSLFPSSLPLSRCAMDDRVPAPADPPPDHSSLIASKLLQGWTLLADSCPVCLTPLVRNRHRQVFCVSCSQWLLTEDQLALKLEAQHVHDSAAPSSPLPPKPAPPPASHMRVASLRDDGPSLDERSPKRLASTEILSGVSFNILEDTNMSASPPGPSDQLASNLPKVLSNVNPPVVLSNLVSTLYQKLEEIRQAITACQEIRDLNQLLSALGECMQAIQRAQDLSQSGYSGKL